MNKFSKLFLTLAASVMMLSSCSSDEPGGPVAKDGDVFATLTLSLPQGSRSETITPGDNTNSSDGFETGNSSENNVGSVLVVLAQQVSGAEYTYVASSLADAHTTTSTGTPARPTYNVQFQTRDLYELAGQEIYVFAFCNPTTDLVTAAANGFAATGGFVNAMGNIQHTNIWAKNAFLMSNASLTAVNLPTQTQMDQLYNTPTNPFNLGVVKVERAAARFDFKQTTVAGQTTANLYPIYNHANSDIDEEGNVTPSEVVGYVQLDGMALINQAINYYYLPRVSADGSNTASFICGAETPSNYVVSPNADEKSADPLDIAFIRANYMFNGQPATGASNGMIFESLTYEPMNTSLGEDDDNNWGPDGAGIPGYNIWKYTTENTIPMVDNQRKGITTGIAFRGHIVASDNNADLKAVIEAAANPIYGYNGIIYGDLEMLKAAVAANPVSTLAETFKAAYGIDNLDAETLEGIVTDLTSSNGFAIYRPVDGIYPVYYAYYNRHNDNGLSTIMAPMEFSVVRNNVYKIAVQNILEFGHTGTPGDDPDPETPDTPDETPKTYFRVQVQVLPWVVRVNNIIL